MRQDAAAKRGGRRTLGRALRWWSFLITGIAWMLVALIVLRFDYKSVVAIALLLGSVALAAGIGEITLIFVSSGRRQLLNALMAVVFIAIAVIAFIHPVGTFVALAAVFSFFLVFAGFYDIVESDAARQQTHLWWLQLIGGIVELVLGFWAAGYWGRSAALLVAWIAAFALIHGVRDIVLAFRTAELQRGEPRSGATPSL